MSDDVKSRLDRTSLDIVAEYAEAICTSDSERMAACRMEGYQLDFVHRDASGGEPLTEREACQFWEAWFKAFPDMDFQVTRTILAETVAVTQWVFTAVNSGLITPPISEVVLEPTGKPIRFRGASIFDLNEGKIQHESMYVDFATIWAELGVTP
jgi:predicted ester cyclase